MRGSINVAANGQHERLYKKNNQVRTQKITKPIKPKGGPLTNQAEPLLGDVGSLLTSAGTRQHDWKGPICGGFPASSHSKYSYGKS